MRKTIFSVFTVIMSLLSVFVFAFSASAAGSSMNSAEEVVADGKRNNGTIKTANTKDWYFFTTGETSDYYYFTLHNESGTGNIHLVLYSERNEEIMNLGNYTSAGEEISCNIKLRPGVKYYIMVYMNSPGTGNYYFYFTKRADEIGDSKDNAEEIKVNSRTNSSIDGAYDKDFFVIRTGDIKQEYLLVYENLSGTTNGHLLLYTDRDEKLLDLGEYTGAGDSYRAQYTFEPDSTYYLVANFNDEGTGNYSFLISQCINGHQKSEEWVIKKEPTCKDKGEKVKVCTVCGEILKSETMDTVDHDWGEWKVIRKSTIIIPGVKEAECLFCGVKATKKDLSKVWILPVIILAGIFVIVGTVNYIRSYRRS